MTIYALDWGPNGTVRWSMICVPCRETRSGVLDSYRDAITLSSFGDHSLPSYLSQSSLLTGPTGRIEYTSNHCLLCTTTVHYIGGYSILAHPPRSNLRSRNTRVGMLALLLLLLLLLLAVTVWRIYLVCSSSVMHRMQLAIQTQDANLSSTLLPSYVVLPPTPPPDITLRCAAAAAANPTDTEPFVVNWTTCTCNRRPARHANRRLSVI